MHFFFIVLKFLNNKSEVSQFGHSMNQENEHSNKLSKCETLHEVIINSSNFLNFLDGLPIADNFCTFEET